MLQVIGGLIPIAMAMALSSIPFLATVVVMLSPRRTSTAMPYLIGYVGGAFVAVALANTILRAVPVRIKLGGAFGIIEVVLGSALIALAIVQWRIRHRRAATSKGWLDRLGKFGPGTVFGFAVALNFRPKSILLAAAAGVVLARADLQTSQSVISLLIYTVVASLTVTIPVVATVLHPDAASAWLIRTRDWLSRNGAIITVVVLLMVGTTVLGNGLVRL